jgi:hypothetical protein
MAHAVKRRDADGVFYVGRYRTPDGKLHQTRQFDAAKDALDEARELQDEAAAGGRQ